MWRTVVADGVSTRRPGHGKLLMLGGVTRSMIHLNRLKIFQKLMLRILSTFSTTSCCRLQKKMGSYILHEGTVHSCSFDSPIVLIYRLLSFEALAALVIRVSNFILLDMHYCSLQGLLRALGRIIRSRIAANAVASGTRAESFNILKDPRYAKVKLAADEAALRSITAGLGKDVKRSDILTIAEERLMLSQEKCQINSPHGINLTFGYFCTRNFMIRGAQELRNTDAEDFSLHSDNYGEYIRYQQGTSKNWSFDIAHCSVKDFRPAINCYITDVVETFKALMAHMPVFKVAPPHPLFLTPIHNVKTDRQNVWFMVTPVGHNKLAKISKMLTEDLHELKDKSITNKTGRGVAISRMSDALVPVEDGMKISGHRDQKSYTQYDQGQSDCKGRAMQRCISGELLNGRVLMFDEAFSEEMERSKRVKVHV